MLENIELAASNMPWLFSAFFFVFGACVGSFLNVCIYRIPEGKSIISPPSHCKCGAKIKWYDNIPILSWFILKGRARCCYEPFSFRYPFVETLCAVVFACIWNFFPMAQAFAYMFFFALMVVVSFIDIDCMELPDLLTVGGCVAGVVVSFLVPQIHVKDAMEGAPFLFYAIKSALISVIGIAVSTGFLYWFRLLAEYVFKREAMGEGDVVLIGCIGAFCGWQGAIFAIFGGSLIGSLIMIPIIIWFRIFVRRKKIMETIPYGPWLAIGAAVYLFVQKYVDFYFEGIKAIFF